MAALAVVLGLAYATRPEPARAAHNAGTERAPVQSSLVACPNPSGSASAPTRVSVATGAESGGPGRAELRPVGGRPQAEPAAVVQKPGTAWSEDFRGKSSALTVAARGSLAAGMAAEQTTRDGGDGPGLAGIRCSPPGMSFWFAGVGPSALKDGQLYLTNVDSTTATVDIDVFTPEGMVDPMGGRSVTVEPHSQRTVDTEELAPNMRLMAVHVRTIIGRVAAAVRTRTAAPAGVDWLPVAQEPTTRLVVPGLPKGDDARQLLLVAPGDRDAMVTMHAVTKRGTYVPEGRKSVQVPAGSVLGVDLAAGLSGRAASVRLSSDVPITAGAYATNEVGIGASDVAFTAATPALDGMAVVADNRAGDGKASVLQLSAPRGEAQVRISLVTSKGVTGQATTVRVPSGRTVSVKIPAPQGAAGGFAVVAAPRSGSGPVYGARLLTDKVSGGEMLTVLPLVTARTWVTVPAVGESLSALLTPQGGRGGERR